VRKTRKQRSSTFPPVALDKAHTDMLEYILRRTDLTRAAWVRRMIREHHQRLPYEQHAEQA
jgi:hypothetical protein